MSINLSKGGSVNLKKEAPNLKRLKIGLGWDPVGQAGNGLIGFGLGLLGRAGSGPNFDVDASVICIRPDGRHEDTIYFGKKRHSSGAIIHSGDNLTGAGDGDDEQIQIMLDQVPATVDKMVIIVNIYDAHIRGQHFGKVKNCFVRAEDMDTGRELVKYQISDAETTNPDYNNKTGIFFAEVYRYKGEWKFKAVGEGVNVRSIDDMVSMKCNP